MIWVEWIKAAPYYRARKPPCVAREAMRTAHTTRGPRKPALWARQPQAREDMTFVRRVEVSETGALDDRPREGAAATQRVMRAIEPGQGVFGVRKGRKTFVAVKGVAAPLPYAPGVPQHVCAAGDLPFVFMRQAGACISRERRRLVMRNTV